MILYKVMKKRVSFSRNLENEFSKAEEESLTSTEELYFMGVRYERGYGVPINDAKAVKWYLKAAEQGNINAQLSLGIMCENGKGGDKINRFSTETGARRYDRLYSS